MQLGKRVGRTVAATDATGLNSSRLFYVRDRHNNTCFLIDPHTLVAVNNSPVRTYGQCSFILNFGLRCSLPWIFIIADVQKPILGADFLAHYGLTVDMRHSKLIDQNTHLRIQGIVSSCTSPSPSLYLKDSSNPYSQLLSEFPQLSQINTPDTPVKHNVLHHIETTRAPVSARPQRQAPNRLQVAKREFEHMLQLGIIPGMAKCGPRGH